MLKMNYGQLRDPHLSRAMAKIASAPIKSPKLAINVVKIMARCDEELKLFNDLHVKLVDLYAVKTADGKVDPYNEKPGTFWIADESAAEWGEKLAELHAIEFEIDRPALDLEGLMVAGITPVEIGALEPLLAYADDVATVTPLSAAPAQ